MQHSSNNTRFSLGITRQLEKAGWYEGRKYLLDRSLPDNLTPEDIFPAARQILEEFGGLWVNCADKKDHKTTNLDFDAEELALFTTEELTDIDQHFGHFSTAWNKVPGVLAQIGGLTEFNTSVLVDEEGVVYIDGDTPQGCFCIKFSNGIDDLIEGVLGGNYQAGQKLWNKS